MGNLERIERQHVSRAREYAACTKDSLICLVFFGGFCEKFVIFDEKRAVDRQKPTGGGFFKLN